MRLVIVADHIPVQLQRIIEFLNEQMNPAEVLAVEVKQYVAEDHKTLVPRVIGQTARAASTKKPTNLPKTDKATFLEACDEAGRPVFEAVLDLADSHNLKIRWGVKGFSCNVDVDGTYVSLFTGLPTSSRVGQSINSTFTDVERKVANASDMTTSFKDKLLATGLFARTSTGNKVRWIIQQKVTTEHIAAVTGLFSDLAETIRKQGVISYSDSITS